MSTFGGISPEGLYWLDTVVLITCQATVVFTIGQNPKTYENKKAERFYILFSPVRVYLIVQDLSTMILRKISKIKSSMISKITKLSSSQWWDLRNR